MKINIMQDFVYDPPTDPLEIVYSDSEIIVVNKPSGLLSVPGKLEGREDCLVSRLQHQFPSALLVHRLDCDTSGLIIFARNKKAQGFLGQEFEQRRAEKTYIARVSGIVQNDDGLIDLPLSADWPNRPRQMVNHEQGRPAQTGWEVMARGDGETRMRLFPKTGRSHQLRVHMLALGHPILGDPIYATGPSRQFPRLMLHAETLALHHPASKNWVRFVAPAPF